MDVIRPKADMPVFHARLRGLSGRSTRNPKESAISPERTSARTTEDLRRAKIAQACTKHVWTADLAAENHQRSAEWPSN